MLPWTNFPPPAEWIWAMPLAVPRQILILDSQSSGVRPLSLCPVIMVEMIMKTDKGGRGVMSFPVVRVITICMGRQDLFSTSYSFTGAIRVQIIFI
jgi:hypothetical protein